MRKKNSFLCGLFVIIMVYTIISLSSCKSTYIPTQPIAIDSLTVYWSVDNKDLIDEYNILFSTNSTSWMTIFTVKGGQSDYSIKIKKTQGFYRLLAFSNIDTIYSNIIYVKF